MDYLEIPKFADRTEWLRWRCQGVGASDASIIMGVSRFKTIDELAQEKALGTISEGSTYITQRGNAIEFQVRMFFEKLHNKEYTAMNIQSKTHPWELCSLDGISVDRESILEIKLLSVINPQKPNYETAGYKKWQGLKETQTIPVEYYPQVQYQLHVSGAKYCYFVGYCEEKGSQVVTDDKLAIAIVLPDQQYIESMRKKVLEFWDKVNYYKSQLANQELLG